jgi:hypothetical protein
MGITNQNVNKIERDQIAAALALFEECDVDAANLLRTVIRAYCVFDVDLLEMREMLLRVEARCKALASESHELAMRLERVARDAEL